MAKPELAQYYSEKQDDGRAYKHPLTGETVPSVTTVLKMADKSGLAQWAADKAVEWCVLNWHLLGSRSDEDAYRAARWQWKKVRDERAQVGTGVHEAIEDEHSDTFNMPELDEEQERIMLQWEQLKLEHEIVPVMSEMTVWEPGLYAGTSDGLWWIDGVLTLVDIKTSKNIWPEHFAQLAALLFASKLMVKDSKTGAWSEEDRPDPSQAAIIHLREDKHEIIIVEDLDLHYDKFMGYHQVWTATQAVKSREKARLAEGKQEDGKQ